MERPTATERDHRVASEIFAVLDGVHTGGVGHVLVDDLSHAAGSISGRQAESVTDRPHQRLSGKGGGEVDVLRPERVGVKPTELHVGVGDGRVETAAPIGRRPGLAAGRMGADADLAERIDRRDRTPARADLDHLDHRDRDRHARAFLEAGRAVDLEGLGGRRREVLDQGDLCRGATHVVGQHAVAAVAGGEIGGEDGTAGRPRLHEPDGERSGRLDRHQPTTGVDQVERARGASSGEFVSQPDEVAGHQRLDVGVGADRVEALVLAHLGRDLARDRYCDVGQFGEQKLTEPEFVRRVDVGVDEADRDRLVALRADVFDERAGAVLIERHEDLASCVQPFADDVAIGPLNEGGRQHDVEVVLLEPALGAGLDHIAEAVGCDECSLGATPFDEGVCGERRSVDDLGDVAQVDVLLCGDTADAVADPDFGGVVCGEHLGRGVAAVGHFDHDVGEGAANIGTDANTHLRSLAFARRPQRSRLRCVGSRSSLCGGWRPRGPRRRGLSGADFRWVGSHPASRR